MNRDVSQLVKHRNINSQDTQEARVGEVISLDECRQCLGEFQLSDEKILAIRNNLVGIIDSLLNSYIEDKEHSHGTGIH